MVVAAVTAEVVAGGIAVTAGTGTAGGLLLVETDRDLALETGTETDPVLETETVAMGDHPSATEEAVVAGTIGGRSREDTAAGPLLW
jgi:hypothetical protein